MRIPPAPPKAHPAHLLDDVRIKTAAGYADSILRHKKRQEWNNMIPIKSNSLINWGCAFDGADIDSTATERFVENHQSRCKNYFKINANDEMYALAA